MDSSDAPTSRFAARRAKSYCCFFDPKWMRQSAEALLEKYLRRGSLGAATFDPTITHPQIYNAADWHFEILAPLAPSDKPA